MDTQQKSFADAMVDFIVNAEKLPPIVYSPMVQQNTTELCNILRIARFETVLVLSPTESREIVFFEREDYDLEHGLFIEKQTGEANQAIYRIFPYAGAPEWSETEREQIAKFVSAMFIVNGRARVMCIAERLNFYDEELDMFNVKYFFKTLKVIIAQGNITDYGCCSFDMKGYASVNTRIGRENGTAVLKRFAEGLSMLIAPGGFVSRMGGDNFIALFKKEQLTAVQNYLMGTNIATGTEHLPEIRVSAHAGYYIIKSETSTYEEIVDRVTVAKNLAKNNTKLPYVVYDEGLKKLRDNKKMVEGLFEDALAKEEFLVYYQPKVNLRDCSLSGAEALCRWKHGDEMIQPMQFIPVLEQSNKICVLDFYILEHVCRDIRRWLDQGLTVVRVSVNMSRVHLGDVQLGQQILGVIDKYQIPHEYIEIELTETTTDVDFTELKRIVNSLHQVGVRTSVDDFGVGYSSLNLIRDLPWNVLKIDKSFLPDATDSDSNGKKVMLKYVISMAHHLGLECIVEGVETRQQIDLLKEYDCYRAQGYFFDRPLPVEQFEKRLREADLYRKLNI